MAKNSKVVKEEDRGKKQAMAQIASIVEMVNNLDNSDYAAENGEYSAHKRQFKMTH